MLVTSGYAFDQENHTVKTDITNEVSGTGYTAGGAYLTSPTVAEAARVTTFDAADTPWTSPPSRQGEQYCMALLPPITPSLLL